MIMKRIIIAGLLGGLTLFIWGIVSHGILPFKRAYTMKTVPDQMEVHQMLKDRIAEEGYYVVPFMSNREQEAHPTYRQEPIFEIKYTGETHGTVRGFGNIWVITFLLAPLTVSWMLTHSSKRIQSGYWRRVMFITGFGIFAAFYSDLSRLFVESNIQNLILFYAVNSIFSWFLAGFVIAKFVLPDE